MPMMFAAGNLVIDFFVYLDMNPINIFSVGISFLIFIFPKNLIYKKLLPNLGIYLYPK